MSAQSLAHGNRLAYGPAHLRLRFDLGSSIAVFEDWQIVDEELPRLLDRMDTIRSSPHKLSVLTFADLPRGVS